MFSPYNPDIQTSIRHRMVNKNEMAKLSREDWINRGLKVLAEGGVEAVRVEPLARRLAVTKGSFYWHFKNRQALLLEILQAWVNRRTDSIIDQVEAAGGSASAKLMYLFELAVQDDGRIENAIRAWAASDVRVADVLDQVDRRRLTYTRDLFLAVGFSSLDAMVRARMVYYALIGEFTLGARTDQTERLTEIRLQHRILTRRN